MHHSVDHVWLPISLIQHLRPVVPFLRYSEILIANCHFFLLHLYLKPIGVLELLPRSSASETKVPKLPCSINCVMIRRVVSAQYQHITGTWTNGTTIPASHPAYCANRTCDTNTPQRRKQLQKPKLPSDHCVNSTSVTMSTRVNSV